MAECSHSSYIAALYNLRQQTRSPYRRAQLECKFCGFSGPCTACKRPHPSSCMSGRPLSPAGRPTRPAWAAARSTCAAAGFQHAPTSSKASPGTAPRPMPSLSTRTITIIRTLHLRVVRVREDFFVVQQIGVGEKPTQSVAKYAPLVQCPLGRSTFQKDTIKELAEAPARSRPVAGAANKERARAASDK
eukprot:scaffold68083_cov32-Prasinocladus_malaysianus.AAC.1